MLKYRCMAVFADVKNNQYLIVFHQNFNPMTASYFQITCVHFLSFLSAIQQHHQHLDLKASSVRMLDKIIQKDFWK
jgi:hypothetical protein